MICRKLFGDYIGESARLIIERVNGHRGRDTKSHVLKRSSKSTYGVTQEDFETIGSHSKNYRLKKKITEALLIKRSFSLSEWPS